MTPCLSFLWKSKWNIENTSANNPDENIKERAISHNIILGNEYVLFFWDTISFNWVSAEAQELLKIIVVHVHYTTVRGFSFAGAFMERYKQAHRRQHRS